MATPHPTSAPLRVPRFVERLNAFAVSRGVDVEIVVAPYDDDPELRLWSYWRTTRERFMSLGLLSRGQPMPSKRGTVSIPGWLYRQEKRALMFGIMTSTGEDVLWEIDWGPGEYTITEAGQVEVVTSASETQYHGTADALMAYGIERERLPLGKKPSDSDAGFYSKSLHWWSRRQLDGAIVYRIESQAAYLKRLVELERFEEEMRLERIGAGMSRPVADVPQPSVERTRPAYLRLVVDNTRPISNP